MQADAVGKQPVCGAKPGAVILAAGLASRMQGIAKQLLVVDGDPMVRRTVKILRAAGVEQLVVVTGHRADEIEPILRDSQVQIERNLHYLEGQQSSVLCGLRALGPQPDPVLVVLGDLPLLQAADVQALLAAYAQRAPGIEIIVPRWQGQRGNPVVVSRRVVDRVLRDSDGRNGLRGFIDANRELVASLPVSNDHYVVDLDTPADIDALEQRVGYPVLSADRGT